MEDRIVVESLFFFFFCFLAAFPYVDRKHGAGYSRGGEAIVLARVSTINTSYLHEKLKYEVIFVGRLLPTMLLATAQINYAKRADISGNPEWGFEIPHELEIRRDLFQGTDEDRWNGLEARKVRYLIDGD